MRAAPEESRRRLQHWLRGAGGDAPDEPAEEEWSPSAGSQGGGSKLHFDRGGSNSTLGVGMTIHENIPVKIDDIMNPTAMNAFQAHKAPPANRSAYTTLCWPEAVSRGRTETIDIGAWDKNREALMTSILVAQAQQNDKMRDVVLKHADAGLFEDSMTDAFWPGVLPTIWKNVKSALDAATAPSSGTSSSKKKRKKSTDDDDGQAATA